MLPFTVMVDDLNLERERAYAAAMAARAQPVKAAVATRPAAIGMEEVKQALEAAKARLAAVRSYTARYTRDEIIDGHQHKVSCDLSVSHSPVHVRMVLDDKTVEWNGGPTMHVTLGRLFSRDLALSEAVTRKESRRPISDCGMAKIIGRWLAAFHGGQVASAEGYGNEAHIIYTAAGPFKSSRLRFDSEGFPVETWNHGRDGRCLEHYTYADLSVSR
jgi:hypothetical protein